MNNDPRRRLSRPELPGISAIFNPRKLRRNSTAVSQLLSGTSRHPSVVVTDDNAAEVDFFFSSMSAGLPHNPHSSHTNLSSTGGGVGGGLGPPTGMANGPPHSSSNLPMGSSSGGGGVGSSSVGGGCGGSSSSSVPLLSDQHNIVTIESSLSSAQHQQHPSSSSTGNNSGQNNTNIKPIAKTIATIRRALFSKTARKVSMQ